MAKKKRTTRRRHGLSGDEFEHGAAAIAEYQKAIKSLERAEDALQKRDCAAAFRAYAAGITFAGKMEAHGKYMSNEFSAEDFRRMNESVSGYDADIHSAFSSSCLVRK